MCIKLWLFCTRELGINDPFMNLCQKAHIEKNSNVCSTNSMVGNMIGERFVALSFGESQGKCIGMVVDGCPAGLALTESDIQLQLDLRKPGQSIKSK